MQWFTKEGEKLMQNRLKNLVEAYLKPVSYPFAAPMFGVGKLYIHSKQHHEGMIDELRQLLKIKDVMKFYKERIKDGSQNR